MMNFASPAAPNTPRGFPPPPATTPITGGATPNDQLAAQRTRLQELRSSVNLAELPTDVRGAFERNVQVEAVAGLLDISPGFVSAASTVRIICTPLNVAGTEAQRFVLPAGASPVAYDTMLMQFAEVWRACWNSDAAGEAGYKYWFPDSLKAFSLVRDNNIATNQVGVRVRADRVAEFVDQASRMGCCAVVTEGELASQFTASIWVPEKVGRKFTPVGELVASVSVQVGKPIHVAWDKRGHPGQRALCGSFSESEIRAINSTGGVTLFGDKLFPLTPWTPPRERGVLFIHADRAQMLRPVIDLVIPQLAGFCQLAVSDFDVSMVERSVIVKDIGIAKVEYPYDLATADLIYDLLSRRVIRMVHPRLPNSGSFLCKIAGSLDEMQSMLRSRLLKAPVVEEEEDEDDAPLQVAAAPGAGFTPEYLTNLVGLLGAAATPAI